MKTYRDNFNARSVEESFALIRAERDLILSETIDRMNPLRWASLTDAKKSEWADFRNKLLTITQRVPATFNVVWPQVPSDKDDPIVETPTEGEGV